MRHRPFGYSMLYSFSCRSYSWPSVAVACRTPLPAMSFTLDDYKAMYIDEMILRDSYVCFWLVMGCNRDQFDRHLQECEPYWNDKNMRSKLLNAWFQITKQGTTRQKAWRPSKKKVTPKQELRLTALV